MLLSISPAFSSAPANAIPPPNNNNIPHAILVVSFHSRMRPPLSFMPDGAINSAVAPIIAIMVSSSLITLIVLIRSLVIHSNAIVFASGYIKLNEMVKTGFVMNIVAVILISLFCYYVVPLIA